MVETSPLPKGTKRYDPSVVKNFLSTALIRVGVEPDDADLVGDVLVGADLRGVRSHGAARLSYFIVRLEKGTLNLQPNFDLKMNTNTTGLLDADNAIGIIAANKADICKDLDIIKKISNVKVIPCSAETELILRKAAKANSPSAIVCRSL